MTEVTDGHVTVSQPPRKSMWRKLRAVVAVGSVTRSLFASARLKKFGRGAATEAEAEAISLHFWQQGDSALYTDEAVKKRASLRNHPGV